MSDKEEKGSGFKVTDKRRFDSTGNERAEGEPEPKVAAKVSPNAKSEPASGQPQADDGSEDSIDFSSFVMSLATQALVQLGELKAPPGVDITVDRTAAKQTIDILSMIQLKTKGNLDPDEGRLIEEIVHNLRLSFLRVAK